MKCDESRRLFYITGKLPPAIPEGVLQIKEYLEYDQMTFAEYIDPFTGEPAAPT